MTTDNNITIILPEYQVKGLLDRQERWMEVCRVKLDDESLADEHPAIQRKLNVHADIYRRMRGAYEAQRIAPREAK